MPKKKSKKKTKTRELPPGGGGDKTGELPPGGGGDKSDALQLKDSVKHHRMDEIKSFIDSYYRSIDNFADIYVSTFNTENIQPFIEKLQVIKNGLHDIFKSVSSESKNLIPVYFTEDLVKIIQDKNSLLLDSDIVLLETLVNEISYKSSPVGFNINDIIEDIYFKLSSLENSDQEMYEKKKKLTEITIRAYSSGGLPREKTLTKLHEIFKTVSITDITETLDEYIKNYKKYVLKMLIPELDIQVLANTLVSHYKIQNFPEVILQYISAGDIENAKAYLHNILYIYIPNYQLFYPSKINGLWRKIVNEMYNLLEKKINTLIKSGDFNGAERLLNNFLNVKLKEVRLEDDRNFETKIKISINNAKRKAAEIGSLLLKEEEIKIQKAEEKKIKGRDKKIRLKTEREIKDTSKKFFNQVIDNIIDNTIQQSETKAEQKALIEKEREEEEKASRIALQVKVKQEREKAAKQVKEKAKKQRQKAARALRKEEVEQSVLAEEARMIYNTKTPTMYENPPSLYQLGIDYPLDEFIPVPPDEPSSPNDQEPIDEYYKSLKELSLSYPIPKPTEEEIERIKSRIGSTNLSAAAEPFVPASTKPSEFVQKQGGRSKKKTKKKTKRKKSKKSKKISRKK